MNGHNLGSAPARGADPLCQFIFRAWMQEFIVDSKIQSLLGFYVIDLRLQGTSFSSAISAVIGSSVISLPNQNIYIFIPDPGSDV